MTGATDAPARAGSPDPRGGSRCRASGGWCTKGRSRALYRTTPPVVRRRTPRSAPEQTRARGCRRRGSARTRPPRTGEDSRRLHNLPPPRRGKVLQCARTVACKSVRSGSRRRSRDATGAIAVSPAARAAIVPFAAPAMQRRPASRTGPALHCLWTERRADRNFNPPLRPATELIGDPPSPRVWQAAYPKQRAAVGPAAQGRDRWPRRWKAQVLEDRLDCFLFDNECQHGSPAAAGAAQYIFAEHAQEQLGPGDARRKRARFGWLWCESARGGLTGLPVLVSSKSVN